MAAFGHLQHQHAGSLDSAISALALPSVGSAMIGVERDSAVELLRKGAPRCNAASMARITRYAMHQGWLTQAHMDFLEGDDAEAGLRIATHDALHQLGRSVRFATTEMFTKGTREKLAMAMSRQALEPKAIAPLIRQGLVAGLYAPDALAGAMDTQNPTTALPNWWQQQLEAFLNRAVRTGSQEGNPLTVEISGGEFEDATLMTWFPENGALVTYLHMPRGEDGDAVQLRDLMTLLCEVTQHLVADFMSPRDLTIGNGMYMDMESDLDEIRALLPSPANADAEAVQQVLYDMAPDANEANGYEPLLAEMPSLLEHLEYRSMTGLDDSIVDGIGSWAAMIAEMLHEITAMEPQLPAYCVEGEGVSKDEAKANMLTYLTERLQHEGEGLARIAPATAKAMQDWCDWLNKRQQDGQGNVTDPMTLCSLEIDGPPMEMCMFASPRLNPVAEDNHIDMIGEDVMSNGGGIRAVQIDNTPEGLAALEAACDHMIGMRELHDMLSRLERARQNDLGLII